MLNNESPQGIYAPLSQGMTDSESEEEIHNSAHHNLPQHHLRYQQQQISQQFQQQQQLNQRTLQVNISPLQHSDYHPCLRMGEFHNQNFTSFNSDGEERNQTDADNVAILGSNDKNSPMSPIRKTCFILSLILCFGTVIVFLWVIPCDENGTCPAQVDRIKTHNWRNAYDKFELKGMVNVVNGLRSWERNLIFMYRSDKFFAEFQTNNHKRNGIVSLIGNSGKISWYHEMENEPVAIDCTLIDINRSGKPDCLVLDEYGQLGAFDPVWGFWLWNFRDNGTKKVDVLDFPVILPDLDGDKVFDLLFATTNKEDGKRNLLRIISGRVGAPFGEGHKISDCMHIRKFHLEDKSIVSFNCINNGTEQQRSKSVLKLYSMLTNKQLKNITKEQSISQHKLYGQRKDTEAQRNIYTIKNKELVIENRGKCPDDCNMTVTWSEKNGKNHVIGFINGSRMYGMVPAHWSFKGVNGNPELCGFVMKFWEWSQHNPNHSKYLNEAPPYQTRQKRNENYQQNSYDNYADEYNIFDHLIDKRSTYNLPSENSRTERSIANTTKQKTNVYLNYKMRLVKEKVVLIVFNSADTRIENVSQSNIVQFCRNEKLEIICQPDLNNQENSLVIADLDQDGSQELVSYYTTFTNKEAENGKNWKLKTYVTLLRLESELPTLYEDFKRH
ncbi:uncharacterized protein LOC129606584 isoform X2 [Condylostylus longicornis]|uniref:uncharacterized protein LOC129606584 isoform X2 n=1 Tax=Condylostylus longicornis TaxID=2530218 RepID=UPI00244E41AA|nr:uncharacterized protein LOC129606584 isoform X2 [Condylostylus longicornis]